MRFDRARLSRAVAAIAHPPAEALPGGVSTGEAEQMANAAQALLTMLREIPLEALEQWQASTASEDRRAVLAAVIAVRAAMRHTNGKGRRP